MPAESARLRLLRERLFRGITERLDEVTLNGTQLPRIGPDGALESGAEERRLPGNLNLSFAGVEGEALLVSMKNVAVSSGSACTSAQLEPSHVLTAIGVPAQLAHASLRFGLGRWTTQEEVDYAIETATQAVERLRENSPLSKSVRS
jgi:cysteine desulfurase